MKYRLISWNVNGMRAIEKKGFLHWFFQDQPTILSLQETKALPEQMKASTREPSGYHSYWNSGEKKGYSGVGIYSKYKPLEVKYGFGNELFDREGRILILEYEHFILYNIYFPNGKLNRERLRFKLDFYQEFLDILHEVLKTKGRKTIVACGDFNTAHTEIDLARPKENSIISGFLPEERIFMDRLTDMGMLDTFRVFNKEPGHYTWWDFKTRARERNIGWRIDYFFIDNKSLSRLENAFILDNVTGSDHCPVGINLRFD